MSDSKDLPKRRPAQSPVDTRLYARQLLVTVVGPPVPKGRPRSTRSGRVYTPARTRAYERHVATSCFAVLHETGRANEWPRLAEYEVELKVYRVARRGDPDNFAKSFCDGAEGILWANDKQIRKLTVEAFVDRENPRIEAEVWAVERSGTETRKNP